VFNRSVVLMTGWLAQLSWRRVLQGNCTGCARRRPTRRWQTYSSAVQVINGAEWRFALLALGTGLSAAIYFVCPTTIAALASV